MSKVVKKVGGVIKKVVKGVVKGVKKVWKKVRESKLGKIITTAALFYFGGAALQGFLTGASGGTGFLGSLSSGMQGAVTGVSNAWSGVTGAASSAVGGNFSQAGQQLLAGSQGQAFVPAGQTVGTTVGAANTIPATPVPGSAVGAPPAGVPASTANPGASVFSQGVQPPSTFPGATTLPSGANTATTVAGSVPAAPPPGLLQKYVTGPVSKTWNAMSPYAQGAAVMTGGQMFSGYMSGKAEEDMARKQLAQYQANVGTYIGMPVYNPETGKFEYPNQLGAT